MKFFLLSALFILFYGGVFSLFNFLADEVSSSKDYIKQVKSYEKVPKLVMKKVKHDVPNY